jgi:hypothetical protein
MPIFQVELKYAQPDSCLTVARDITSDTVAEAVAIVQRAVQQEFGMGFQPTWAHVYLKLETV